MRPGRGGTYTLDSLSQAPSDYHKCTRTCYHELRFSIPTPTCGALASHVPDRFKGLGRYDAVPGPCSRDGAQLTERCPSPLTCPHRFEPASLPLVRSCVSRSPTRPDEEMMSTEDRARVSIHDTEGGEDWPLTNSAHSILRA